MTFQRDPERSRYALEAAWPIGRVVSIEPFGVHPGVVFRVSVEDEYILKWMTDREAAIREWRITSHLASGNLPVPHYLTAQTGEPYAEIDGEFYILYPALPGTPIEERFGTRRLEKARRLSKALGQLHRGLATLPETVRMNRFKPIEQIDEWATPILKREFNQTDMHACESSIDRWRSEMTRLLPELPMQAIHRDPHYGNFLFTGTELTGILDFSLVMQGQRIFDPCYAAQSILSERSNDEEKDLWPEILAALFQGYDSIHPISHAERSAVPAMMIYIALIFVAFFLDRGDKELAARNLHNIEWFEDIRDRIDAARVGR